MPLPVRLPLLVFGLGLLVVLGVDGSLLTQVQHPIQPPRVIRRPVVDRPGERRHTTTKPAFVFQSPFDRRMKWFLQLLGCELALERFLQTVEGF